ncbi:MAG: Tim44-like domain-containing protein [Mycoplasmatota bacterium]
MKKNKYTIIGIAVIVLIAFVLFATPVFADVGNYNDYSSSYDSSSYDSFSSDSSSDGNSFETLLLSGFIILIAILSEIIVGKRKTNTNKYESNLAIMENVDQKVKEIDPDFSESEFITFANEVFVKIQTAWTKRDWRDIRAFESDELFSVHSMQLQEYIDNKKINKIEKIAILNTKLINFHKEAGKDILVVRLTARFKDYVVDEVTNNVLESNPETLWTLTYDMTFTRASGVLTKLNHTNSTTNCPSCGAPTQITSTGMCEYCRSVITIGNHDWVLTDYKRSK